MSGAALSAREISFRYEGNEVLVRVDLELREKEVAVLLGPNGAGKSTLIRICSGLLPAASGSVSLFGRSPVEYPRREMARLLSVVGQDPPVDFPMSVREYVALGRFPYRGFFGGETESDARQVAWALDLTELSALGTRRLGEISAGERQRATVARAIAQGARVMLLDEPTAFLDIRHRVAFYEMVTRLKDECGVSALVASHDLSLCAEYGERIVLLAGGTVRAAGRPEEVLTPETIVDAFGVEVICDRNPATGAVRVTPKRKERTT